MKCQYLILVILGALLAACGGGGGSIDKDEPNISSSKSSNVSSVSSSSGVATCANTLGAVFINEVCGAWEEPSFYEQNRTNYTGGENTTGVGNNLTLSVISESENAQNKVIDIHYGNNSVYSAIPRFLSNLTLPNGVNMAEYVNGSLQFDLKVISAGINNPNIQLSIECAWPCASTFVIVEPGPLNTWKTVEIPVANLIDRGLNIEKVTTGFQIMPDWNHQNGAHLQVDNIRWVKKNLQTPETNICYANYLRGPETENDFVDVSLVGGGNPEHLNIKSVYPILIFSPKWHLSNSYSMRVGTTVDKTSFLPTDPDAISKCIDNGTLVFDIFIDKGYTKEVPLSIGVGVAGQNASPIHIGSIISSDLSSGQWTKISMPISISQSGLYQVMFNISGPGTSENLGEIMIDNIRIIKPTI
jgi:hypothetical protein